jgi:transglutaminase-like putative cysteine protease
VIYDITHTTEYRFHKSVGLGPHRLTFRPRDDHDMRVLATSLDIQPQAQRIDMLSDVYGNSVAIVLPGGASDHLKITAKFTVDHLGTLAFALPTAAESMWMPPAYRRNELMALHPFMVPSYDDTDHALRQWAQPFANQGVASGGPRETVRRMTEAIRDRFEYRRRDEEGVQTPQQTLHSKSGACRDLATFMIDALRHIGIAARFVSGYVYVPASEGILGGGATHAWVQCYLPDCGWFPADPTNNLIGGNELIRVAVSRHASEVSPLSGQWFGAPNDAAGMTVDVQVVARPPR